MPGPRPPDLDATGQPITLALSGTTRPPDLDADGQAMPPSIGAGDPDDDNSLATYGRHTWQTANPVTNIGGLLPFPKAAGGSGLDHPFNPVKIKNDMLAVKAQADDLWSKGDYTTAALKYLESFAPILGPMMSHQGNQLEKGQYAAAAGDLTGMGISAYVTPKLAGAAVRSPRVVKPAADPVVQYARRNKIPLTVGQATGNRFAQGSTAMADWTPIGSLIEYLGRKRANAAMRRVGGEIAQDVRGGGPVDQEVAGANTREQLGSRKQAHEDFATNRYGIVEKNENYPSNMRNVRQRPGAQKGPMKLPVDRRSIKARLKPIYERLQQNLPVGREQMSEGYKALWNIINGDDYVPLTISEEDLGFLKTLARETKGRNQALAQQAVRELQGANDTTASSAGPHVVRALAEARDAARMGFETEALLEKTFGDEKSMREPGALVRSLTANDNHNIAMLRRVKEQVPAALPGIARSFIDKLMEQKGAKLQADWKHLGVETKKILFTPAQIEALDLYAEVAARIAYDVNPSHSALTAVSGWSSNLGALYAHPVTGIASIGGGGAISAIMRSPMAVRLATQAWRLALKPAGTTALASARAAQVTTLLRAAERAAGVPVTAQAPVPATDEASAPPASTPELPTRQPRSSR